MGEAWPPGHALGAEVFGQFDVWRVWCSCGWSKQGAVGAEHPGVWVQVTYAADVHLTQASALIHKLRDRGWA